ncbi:MAG: glycosyltransferase family 4 protein [Minisyncoccia bacterium]
MIKLLFITQKVDKNDDVLGVYHRWIEELSRKVDRINVICLYQGRTELPVNVRVFSLRKEYGSSRWRRVFLFYKYIWILRKDYNSVFVHMNPLYILLGGLFWKIGGKQVFLWYNHPLGSLTTKLGIFLSHRVFCTSPFSFVSGFKKTRLMPVGIDTDFFKRNQDSVRRENSVLYLGRVSPIKNLECLLAATRILDRQNISFVVNVVGAAVSESNRVYLEKIKNMAADLTADGKVVFGKPVRNIDTPLVYVRSGVFVNLTATGSFDKAVVEAMACETPILVSNKLFDRILPPKLKETCLFNENDADDLSKKIIKLLCLSKELKQEMGKELREIAVEKHSLALLIEILSKEFSRI